MIGPRFVRQKSPGTSSAIARHCVFFYPRRRQIAEVFPEPAYAAAHAYDRWLLDYTTEMLRAYEPKPIGGGIMIFRSTSEPTGPFLDAKLGWGGMAGEVGLTVIPGDHFTVFSDPGVSILAKCIETSIRPAADNAIAHAADAYVEMAAQP